MKTPCGMTAFVFLAISCGSVAAGTIRCQGEIIRDDQIEPLIEAQVREKCGEPASEESGMLMYRTEDNVIKVLRFNDAGQLESITEQLGE